MPRYKLIIEYHGAPYVGWQRQSNGHSVQGALEKAVYEFCGETVTIGGAGRTDTGVHALGQVAHVDLQKDWPAEKVQLAINAKLKGSGEKVVVMGSQQMEEGWDSRFSAIRRHYRYRLINRRPRLTIERGLAWHCNQPLDVDAMNEAAQVLVGHHDFTTFRHSRCQAKSPLKTLEALTVRRGEDDLILVETSSRSFLHNQVRSMVGSLRLVGENRWSGDDLENALDARDRAACGPVAPPDGLYLTKVDY
ncbi:MAG: tRNA pseudouridine(38-40) synthase TruA [Stappiaceae bacterium]